MTTAIRTGSTANATTDDTARGWYLYGITRSGTLDDVLAQADAEQLAESGAGVSGDLESLRLLEHAGLAAVVRPVRIEDFSQAAMQERLRSESDLEAMVRSHNRVIEAIHAQQAIVPAKFGMVYVNVKDIERALEAGGHALLPQLELLDGCDEWALHLYADRARLRDRVSAEDLAVQLLRAKCASAPPGRAYFLERQLRDEVESAIQEEMLAAGQHVFNQLGAIAVSAQMNPTGTADAAAVEVEILRAAFLVKRDDIARFEHELRSLIDTNPGLRYETTGPWPPYSFAAREEEAQ